MVVGHVTGGEESVETKRLTVKPRHSASTRKLASQPPFYVKKKGHLIMYFF